jgi:hypothetical protein
MALEDTNAALAAAPFKTSRRENGTGGMVFLP